MNTKAWPKIAIIGGGAAGFFAAANLAEQHPCLPIAIFEAGRKFLAKVEISGGGRCNVTHHCFDPAKLCESYPRGKHELRGPFSRFSPTDTIDWFAKRGVELKAEADGRMFPVSDSSRTIIDCLIKSTEQGRVALRSSLAVRSVEARDGKFILELAHGEPEEADYLILASGSSKKGHKIAESLGHSISECAPSLFTFTCRDTRLHELAGVSFPDAHVTLETPSGKKFTQRGPVLITHWGLSGPAVLKLSAFAARELAAAAYHATVTIQWIASLGEQQVREELLSLRKSSPKKELGSNPQFGLTRRFWERLLEYCEIPHRLAFAELSNEQIQVLSNTLTKSLMNIEGKGEFKEEFVTCGGVRLKEIDFQKFQSKLVPNLFFAGEILDIDGITGGFNFQAAWTGGFLAARAIGEMLKKEMEEKRYPSAVQNSRNNT